MYGAPPHMPYAPSPYAPTQYASAPMPYAPYYAPQQAYVQGAYMPQDSSSFMQPTQHAPYDSSSLYMPSTAPAMAENNVPPRYAEEDCGCDEQQQPIYPYTPPPSMHGAPYYPSYPQALQAPYYQAMPYVPYAPQPGVPYYRPEPTAMFGVPNVDDDEKE